MFQGIQFFYLVHVHKIKVQIIEEELYFMHVYARCYLLARSTMAFWCEDSTSIVLLPILAFDVTIVCVIWHTR